MNNIAIKQVETPMLNLLRAQRLIYSQAKKRQAIFLVVAFILPFISLVNNYLNPGFKSWVALIALIIAFLEALVFEPWFKQQLKTAAKLKEDFDCNVLEMEWNPFLVGKKVHPEEIFQHACKRFSEEDEKGLLGWYPDIVRNLPLHLARLVCQRTNLWYDGELRKHYRGFLLGVVILIVLVVMTISLWINCSMESLMLSAMTPLAPIVIWTLKEFNRQKDNLDLLVRLDEDVRSLFECSRKSSSEKKISTWSRELQDAIYNHRVSNPLIFDWFYKRCRPAMEGQMNAGAEHWVKELADK